MTYIIGLDIGQAKDFTATTVLDLHADGYDLVHAGRLVLGVNYPSMVELVKRLANTPPLQRTCKLAVDATGVGRPTCDLLAKTGLPLVRVTITAGKKVTFVDGSYHVPKSILVFALVDALQSRRLRIAKGLVYGPAILGELTAFQSAITKKANMTFEGKGQHDDLVLALAIAVWVAENT